MRKILLPIQWWEELCYIYNLCWCWITLYRIMLMKLFSCSEFRWIIGRLRIQIEMSINVVDYNKTKYDIYAFDIFWHKKNNESCVIHSQRHALWDHKEILYWLKVTRNIPSPFQKSLHYSDDIMGAMTSQITSLTIVYSTVYSGANQRKYQNSAHLAFVRGSQRWPVNFLHKWSVTRKMFPFDNAIMLSLFPIWQGLLEYIFSYW